MLSRHSHAPVLITLGTTQHRCWPLTMADLADFDAYCEQLHHAVAWKARYLDPAAPDYRQQLEALRDVIKQFPRERVENSEEAIAFLVARCLRLDSVEAALPYVRGETATVQQVSHLLDLAYRRDPVALLNDLLLVIPGKATGTTKRPRDNRPELLDWACRTYGWSLPEALALTPGQLELCLGKGKALASSLSSSGGDPVEAARAAYLREHGTEMPWDASDPSIPWPEEYRRPTDG